MSAIVKTVVVAGRNSKAAVLLVLLGAAAACAAACTSSEKEAPDTELVGGFIAHVGDFNSDGAFAPLPDDLPLDAKRVSLGRRLFEDPSVSFDGKVSCATCHSRALGGANGQAKSSLPGRAPVPINIPSIFNLAFNFRFSWSGKFEDIGAQIDAAMGLPAAMNTTWEDARRRTMAEYGPAFSTVYAEGFTDEAMRDALSQYCLSLVTPDSKFDRFLRGQERLSEQEERGFAMFREYGCVSCHQGINVGGNVFQRFGVVRDYFEGRKEVTKADLGLFSKTELPADKHVFRVPSLRNVALTAPYFHDGSVSRLEEAVQVMARYQLGRELTDVQAEEIAAFLRTLTGKLRDDG